MRHFDYSSFLSRKWDKEIVNYIALIREFKGRQDLYLSQSPEGLTRLVEIAKRQSTEASNAIEGIQTTNERLAKLMVDKVAPRNRDEKEILGYRRALAMVHESFEYIPIRPNSILQLHGELCRYADLPYAGKFKSAPNEIDATLPDGTRRVIFEPLQPYETPMAVESLCEQYEKAVGQYGVDPLLVIPVFILDFLCIHPFIDGNGRMSRLVMNHLQFEYGLVPTKINKDDKAEYIQALVDSREQGTTDPFREFMLQEHIKNLQQEISTFKEAMEEVETKGGQETGKVDRKGGQKTREAILDMIADDARITSTQMAERLGINRSAISKHLKKLQEKGIIRREGPDKGGKWCIIKSEF
jgi:Fic family protein